MYADDIILSVLSSTEEICSDIIGPFDRDYSESIWLELQRLSHQSGILSLGLIQVS